MEICNEKIFGNQIITMENKSILSNFIWRFAERCGAQLVEFIVSVVLARVLAPEAYGIVALLTDFTTILQVFVDSGLGNALIQKKDTDDTDFSTVFYANVIFCIILYTALFLCAPLIAAFYDNQSLIWLIRVLGLTIVVSGVKNIQQAYVSKHMLFKRFFFSALGGTIVAAFVGITMAVHGYGAWALVAQQVVNVTIDTAILWITVEWRPKKIFSLQRLKCLYSYGWKLLISSLIDIGYNNLRQLIIGKMYSSADLAYYNRGRQFPSMIVGNINNSIDSVLFPTMSNAQDNRDDIKKMTRRSIKTSIYIMAPAMMGMIFTADLIVKLVLTNKWIGCVPYLQIFCITYMFWPIHTANLNAIKAMGRSDLFLKLEIAKKAVGIILLLSTMRLGAMAMAYSLLVSSVISQIINSWPNKKLLNYGYGEQLKDIYPSIVLSLGMGIVIWGISLFKLPIMVTLIIQILSGVIIYILGSIIFKFDSFVYLKRIVKTFINKK